MTNIIEFGELSINGDPIAMTQEPEIKDGSIKRVTVPQIDGSRVTTQDISTNFSEISITVICSKASNIIFDKIYDNGYNNVITYDGKNYSGAKMQEKPSRKNMEEATYVFDSNPPA